MHFVRDVVFVTLHGALPWNDAYRQRSIHETEQDNFDTHSDNTVLTGQLLSVKHNSTSQNNQTMKKAHGGSGGSNRNYNMKALRFNPGNVRYDRILTFADLNTPGKCFAIITETVNESDQLLQHLREDSSVGDVVVVIEPESPTTALNDMPVVSTI